ncbi:MAG: hypothetical protein HYV78_02210 [Candidatus Wildermuthbacteria bacterium]|nr:hypothetical protein [Candidatus Wildermuthbacteria bacterium]
MKRSPAFTALCVGFIGVVLFVGAVFPAPASALDDPYACLQGELKVRQGAVGDGKKTVDQILLGPMASISYCADLKNTKETKGVVIKQDGTVLCDSGYIVAYVEPDQPPKYCINTAALFEKYQARDAQAKKEAKTPALQKELKSFQDQQASKLQEQSQQNANQWEQSRQEIIKQSKGCGVNVFCILEKIFFLFSNLGLLFFIGMPILFFTVFMWAVAIGSGILAIAFNNILVRGVIQATLNIPVIPGKGVNVVDIGWAFSRDFANLFFLIILVFIGLATILRLPSYQMKKTLPLLLMMAVLVNFSGLLVGFIVDISNIVTNFFLSRVGTWEDLKILWRFSWAMGEQTLNLIRIDNDPRGYLISMLTPATTAAVHAAFFLMLAVVFFYAFFLFIVRISALWTISILSPFAFLAYILPQTRSWWNRWLKELIAWSFMGIPLAFFLYLATYALRHISDITRIYAFGDSAPLISLIDKQAPQQLLERSIQEVIVPTIAIIFLFIGIRLSKQMAPEGAKATMNFLSSLPKKILATRMGQLWQANALRAGQQTFAKIGEGTKSLATRGGALGVAGKALRPLGWAAETANRLVGATMLEQAAAHEKIKAPQGFENWTAQSQEAWITARNLSSRDRLQLASAMADKGTLTAASSAFQDAVTQDAVRAMHEEDARYKKEAKSIIDVLPGKLDWDTYRHMKLTGKTGDARQRAEADLERDYTKTNQHLNAFLKEDFMLETAAKLRDPVTQQTLIAQDQLRESRTNQVLRADLLRQVGPEIQRREAAGDQELDRARRNLSASVMHVREYKPEQIIKIDDLANFTARAGIVFGNPANLQKIQDSLGHSALEDVVTGSGGLNSATNSPEKIQQMLQSGNPRMIRTLVSTPGGRALNWQGRDLVVNIGGQPTEKPEDFLMSMSVKETIKSLRANDPDIIRLLGRRIQ